MREYNGNIVNREYTNMLVDYWKKHSLEIGGTYEVFITLNTGWSHDEFVLWAANGRLPK